MFRPASRFSMSLNNPSKGLLNAPGENNCFLNSAVQVLWHLDVFRRSFKLLSGHSCMDHGKSCIFCALKVIFIQFEYSDQSVLPPDALRKALAKTFQDEKRFQLGFMDDAAECFENILLRIHFHIANGESEDMCNARHCIPHQKFAMTVVEQIVCRCGATSEPLPFSQMVHYVSTSAFMGQVREFSSRGSTPRPCEVFAQLIRNATSAGDARECPSNCNNGQVEIRRNLTNLPDVVSIGLIWDSACPSLEHIRDVVQNIGTKIRLSELFHSSNERNPRDELHLVGLVCYYGKHYSTFFFHSKARRWIYFDDATVREMDGRWDSVVDKCCRGHYQPLLLLYAKPDPTPIDPRTSQQETTMLSGDLSPPPNNNNTGNPGSARYHRPRSFESGGASGEKPMYNYETTLKGSLNVGEIGRNRRAMTPNPDMLSDRIDGNINRRAVTPGPEWGRHQNEDIQPQDQGYGALHTRQSSYMLAVECTHPEKGLHNCDQQGPKVGRTVVPPQQKVRPQEKVGGSHYDYLPPPRKLSDAGRYERNNSATDSYPSGSVPYQNVMAHSMALDYHLNQKGNKIGPNTSNTVGACDNLYQQNVYSGHSDNTTSNQTADWTLSNQDCYRRKAPVSPTKGMLDDPNNQFVYPTQPQSRVVSSLARVNELQKIDATRKGKAGPQSGIDVVRYQPVQEKPTNSAMYGNNRPHHMDNTVAPPNLKRTSSMEDSKTPALYPGNARVRPSSARPYDYGNTRPGVDQRHRPEFNQTQQRGSGQMEWQGTKDTSSDGDYISRKTVENIMKQQISRTRPTGGMEPPRSHHQPVLHQDEYSKNTLKVEIPDNISLGSQRDSGYRSGSSGDRNSNSSGSNTSVDSPTADPYRGCHQKEAYCSRQVPTPMNQNLAYSSNESLSSSHSAQSNSSVRANQKLGNIPESTQGAQSGYQTVKRGVSNYQMQDIPEKPQTAPPVPMKMHHLQSGFMPHEDTGKNPADQHCEMLCMKAEDLMALSGQKERGGDLALALILCTQALGHLQNAMNVKDISQDTRVYTKMKHSTCVLKSRSLHKRIMTRQDSNVSGSDISNEDHISISSVSTDPDSSKDFPPPPDDLMMFPSNEDPEHQHFKDQVKNLYDQGIHCPNKMDGSKKMVPPPYSYAMQYSRTDSGYDSQSSTGSNSQGQYATTGAVRNKQLIHGSAVTNLTTTQSTSLESITSDLSNMEIYGTLPRKTLQKSSRSPSVPDARDLEVFNAQIHGQRQREKLGDERYPRDQTSQKINKDKIRNMLLEDYVNKGSQKWNGYLDEKMLPEQTERHSDYYGAPNDPRNQQAGNTHYYDSQAGHWVSDCVNTHSRQSSCSSSSMGNHSRQDSSSSQNTVIHVRQPNSKSNVPPAPPRVSSQLSHHLPPPDPELLNEARNCQSAWEQGYHDQPSNSIANNLNLMQSQKLQTSKKEKDWSKVPRPLRPKMKKSSSHGNISSFGIDNTGIEDKASLNSYKDGYGSNPKEFAAKLSHSQSAILDPQTAPPASRDLTLPADFKVPSPVKKDKPKPKERDLLKKYHFDEESDAGENKKKPKPKPKPSPPKRQDSNSKSSAKAIPQFQDTLSQPLTCINVQDQKQQQEGSSEKGVSDLIQKFNRSQSDVGIDFNKECRDNRGNPSFQKACVSDLFNTKKPLSGSKSVDNVSKKAVDDLDGCPKPKSAIKKGRSRQRSKTVTFSENIALIVSVDEQPEEIDYMAYVQSVLQQKEKMKSPLTKRKLEHLHKDKSLEPDAKLDSPKLVLKSAAEQVKAAGYDSDFDEDTSESDNEDGSKKIRCSLCRKKMINSTEQYCQGCTFYMSKFQPVS